MRRLAVALVLALAACGNGGVPEPPGPPAEGDAARVKAALGATRSAGTGISAATTTVRFDEGYVTARRSGYYDLKDARAETTQEFATSDPERGLLAHVVGRDVAPETLRARTVTERGTAYVRMERWPEQLASRWVRLPVARVGTVEAFGEVEVDLEPRLLAMLDSARDAPRRGTGNNAVVSVPAPVVFRALPAVRAMAPGVDASALTGDVEVEVALERDMVDAVGVDATALLRQAWAQTGSARAEGVERVLVRFGIDAHGIPVTVIVPSGPDVVTFEEYRRIAG